MVVVVVVVVAVIAGPFDGTGVVKWSGGRSDSSTGSVSVSERWVGWRESESVGWEVSKSVRWGVSVSVNVWVGWGDVSKRWGVSESERWGVSESVKWGVSVSVKVWVGWGDDVSVCCPGRNQWFRSSHRLIGDRREESIPQRSGQRSGKGTHIKRNESELKEPNERPIARAQHEHIPQVFVDLSFRVC